MSASIFRIRSPPGITGISRTRRRSISTTECFASSTSRSRKRFYSNSTNTCSTSRRTASSCCGGSGSCRINPTSRAGRSARAITSTRIWRRCGSTSKGGRKDKKSNEVPASLRLPGERAGQSRPNRGKRMASVTRLCAAGLSAALMLAHAEAAETPKSGGTLTFLIPADAPPSFDGHRENSFATVHSMAPFYSVLIRANPENPGSTTDFVCDLCTEMAQPTDGGKTYTFKIRQGVKFHDGVLLTAADVAASWKKIAFPPEGVISARGAGFAAMVDKIETPDAATVVFQLKRPSAAFLPALADPFAFIYKKEILDKDPHWYEKNILGSGPFKSPHYETGQSIAGVRYQDYHQNGLPYLNGFTGIFADKQATRIDALRADRAAIEFRVFPPSARDELKGALGDQIAVQESDWNCGTLAMPNQRKKPFDDVRVRRALTLAIDRWHGAPALARIANVRTVGGIAFPGHPLAATQEELERLAGYWPDVEKSRAEAKRLLKEAGAEGLSFELLNRNVDQPYKYN